jgi:ABC-2 type transport system ATP-binding protein
MPVIEIEGLTKDFEVGFVKKRFIRALDSVSFSVEEGEIFGFLGPNGAGKTTTLKILMQLIFPTSGTARILGEPVKSVEMHRRIGYLPEQPYFYDYLTARELLDYFGRLCGIPEREIAPRVTRTLERVGLASAALDRQLRRFSKGMLQRIGLAQAILHDPAVVFLDEPMSGLDPIGRRQVRDLILDLRGSGKTIFFSSHILSDVESLCDRVAILNRGRLVEVGRLDSVLANRSGESEIVATAVLAESIETLRSAGLNVTQSPGGVHILVPDQAGIDSALEQIRAAGGRLVSVNPTRRSLEDLFVTELDPGTES